MIFVELVIGLINSITFNSCEENDICIKEILPSCAQAFYNNPNRKYQDHIKDFHNVSNTNS